MIIISNSKNQSNNTWGTDHKLFEKKSIIQVSHRCTVHFVKSLQLLTKKMRLYNFHLKHLNTLRHVSMFSDHHQGVSSFLAKVITYS